MDITICGHDRETLKWALDVGATDPLSKAMHYQTIKQHRALGDIADAARLAAVIGETLRGFGVAHIDVYAEHDTRVVLRIPDLTWPNMPRYCNHAMPAARDLALRLLQLPEGATAEDALREVEKRS